MGQAGFFKKLDKDSCKEADEDDAGDSRLGGENSGESSYILERRGHRGS